MEKNANAVSATTSASCSGNAASSSLCSGRATVATTADELTVTRATRSGASSANFASITLGRGIYFIMGYRSDNAGGNVASMGSGDWDFGIHIILSTNGSADSNPNIVYYYRIISGGGRTLTFNNAVVTYGQGTTPPSYYWHIESARIF